jgi:rod shape-determining protein MreD
LIIVAMFFCLVCGSVLQAIFPTWLWLGEAGAPVLLGLVLYYSLAHDDWLMWLTALSAGILQDALGLIPLGYSSFCFCVVAWIVSRFRETVFTGDWPAHIVFGALSSGGVSLFLSIMLSHGGSLMIHPGWAVLKTFGALLLGAVIVPFEFRLMEALDRTLGNIQERGR